jgi:hypothetical protein
MYNTLDGNQLVCQLSQPAGHTPDSNNLKTVFMAQVKVLGG